ncbi:MAG: 7TM diverse intracellular signaling domain-containing protein [Vicingaceae bacterium]|jgi:signal transduction histidine kinase|nr:GHKL domain-containing protein [Flavobacteriales bacterium]MBQ21358.1 ATPase [Flavobacteriales bacterium]MDF1674279.1 7TM diverse intracellular signaling domain-containing protein [Vicingaceae bacterium]|tara:strand:+ start:50010 stop:52109 length:2100 start_codon:yes stop_codon:yes gene_type:complete
MLFTNQKNHFFLFYILILLSSFFHLKAENIIFNNENDLLNIGDHIEIYEDQTNSLSFKEVILKEFTPSKSPVPNLGISKSNFWIKIPITNKTENEHLILELSLAIIDYVELYYYDGNQVKTIKTGDAYPFDKREYKDPHYLFDLNIPTGETKTYYLNVRSNEALQLPLKVGTIVNVYTQIKNRDLLSGIYFGIMLVMILYNLFIYFSVRDKSYLYYVVYIICILLTQTSLQGYTFQYLWPNSALITKFSLIFLPSLSGITGMFFMNVFLQTKEFSKKLYNIAFIFVGPYLIAYVIAFMGELGLSQAVIQLNSTIISLYMLITPIIIYRKGFKPAKYFIAAWSVFLLGVFIFVLKDMEVLPFNNLTRYTMQIGSAIETILLSFALANRISIIRKENEHLIKEQNVILEQKVKERTAELNKAIENLKQTQSQLVESEKMASLGQLTAGIAHEINNPINFVSSNVFPLKQDIEDLKSILNKYEEITESVDLNNKLNEINQLKDELDYHLLLEELDTIIHGIEDGAKRTAEIVSGLRNFSRLDESEFQSANVNDCITTTLKIIQTKIGDIKIKTELEDIPPIDCYPGKLNQFFLNTIDNAIYAVNAVKRPNHTSEIEIKTALKNNHIMVTLKDNGIGMDETTKNKIFEPFFTTKDVGEGTGLGMSIAHGILEMHQAKIEIESEINQGTLIKIFLPLTLPTWKE